MEALDDPIEYRRQIELLSDSVRQIIATEILLWQVNNGGFHQYFFNSYGIMVRDAVEGLRRIELAKYADIVDRATVLLGDEFPEDRSKRIDLVGETPNSRIDFDPLDEEFFSLDPDMSGFAYDALDAYAEAMLKTV